MVGLPELHGFNVPWFAGDCCRPIRFVNSYYPCSNSKFLISNLKRGIKFQLGPKNMNLFQLRTQI